MTKRELVLSIANGIEATYGVRVMAYNMNTNRLLSSYCATECDNTDAMEIDLIRVGGIEEVNIIFGHQYVRLLTWTRKEDGTLRNSSSVHYDLADPKWTELLHTIITTPAGTTQHQP